MEDVSGLTDWTRCAICQNDKNEPLRCPAESIAKSNIGAGYKTLAQNIAGLSDLGCLPNDFDGVSRLDEGDGLEETFCRRRAKWHLSCYGKFNSTKVERARKRRASSDKQAVGRKYTRSSASTSATCSTAEAENAAPTCFFCDEPGTRQKALHQASTLSLDARVRKCAYTLQDERLLAKRSEGDLVALEARCHAPCVVSLYKKAEVAQEKDKGEEMQRPDGIPQQSWFHILKKHVPVAIKNIRQYSNFPLWVTCIILGWHSFYMSPFHVQNTLRG